MHAPERGKDEQAHSSMGIHIAVLPPQMSLCCVPAASQRQVLTVRSCTCHMSMIVYTVTLGACPH